MPISRGGADTFIQIRLELVSVRCKLSYIIGASLSEPHTYRTAVKNLPYIYMPSGRRPIWPHEGPRKRASVVPAIKGSKVNNIALKRATLALSFSWRSSLPMEQLV